MRQHRPVTCYYARVRVCSCLHCLRAVTGMSKVVLANKLGDGVAAGRFVQGLHVLITRTLRQLSH